MTDFVKALKHMKMTATDTKPKTNTKIVPEQQLMKTLMELNDRFEANFKELLSRISLLRQFPTRSPSDTVTTSNQDPMRTTVFPPTATSTNNTARKTTKTNFAENTKHMKIPMAHGHANDNHINAIEEEIIFSMTNLTILMIMTTNFPATNFPMKNTKPSKKRKTSPTRTIIPTTQQKKK